MKKMFSVILVFAMLICTAPAVPDVFATGYDIAAAVSYAHKYTDDSGTKDTSSYNPEYRQYNSDGGDCMNFVSQCLFAGGLPEDGVWYRKKYGNEFNGSVAWIQCTSFFAYAAAEGYTYIHAPFASETDVGDVILYASSEENRANGKYYHAVFVCEKDGQTVKICGHNNNRKCSVNWNYTYPTVIKISSGKTPVQMWDLDDISTYPQYKGLLKNGSADDSAKRVSFIQSCLGLIGFDCGDIDGKFGAKTQSAVIAFQSSAGLEADGIVGPATWNAITAKMTELKAPRPDRSYTARLYRTSYVYDGAYHKPTVIIKDSDGNRIAPDCYTLTYSSGRKKPGVYTVKIEMKGEYSGTETLGFSILPANVENFAVSDETENSFTLSWDKVPGASGYKIYRYDSQTEEFKLLRTTSKTSYTRTGLKPGTRYTCYIRAYKTVEDGMLFSPDRIKLVAGTVTAPPDAPVLTSGTKKITADWTKPDGATGCELYMASSQNDTYKRIYYGTKLSYTKTGLQKNETYCFKMRTYKTVNGKKIYSDFSEVKSIKVK